MTNPSTIYATIGANIKRLRRLQGKSQQVLADASGTDRCFLSLLEHGKTNVSVGKLAHLASALSVPVTELFVEAANG